MKGDLKVDIPLAMVGCDFRTVAAAIRERMISTREDRSNLFEEIRRVDPEAGFTALETCNRVEWLVSTESPEWMAELLRARMISLVEDSFPSVMSVPNPPAWVGAQALDRVLRVVVGLESLAVGEAQIAGQFQYALARAREEKTTSPILNRLGGTTGRLAKAAYRIGFRSDHRQGIHGFAARLVGLRFKDFSERTEVVVVGMGAMGRRTAQLLEGFSHLGVARVNRTVRREHKEVWHRLDELPALAGNADAIVVATGALEPVITADSLALQGREKPLLVLDIGVPRQVADHARKTACVDYRSIDDLLELTAERRASDVTERLESEIAREAERFYSFCMQRDMASLLDRIHQGRRQYMFERDPPFVESALNGADQETRKRVEDAMMELIRDYSIEIHTALQEALEQHWNRK